MPHNYAPHAHMVKVREPDGHGGFVVVELWPVDAREHCIYGGATPVDENTPLGVSAPVASDAPGAVPLPPVAPAVAAERLDKKSYDELVMLARKVGVEWFHVKREDIVAALLPHVAGGTLSVEDVTLPANVMTPRPVQIEA